ncbi:MAG: VTT domain-containing protein [Smithella sp.]
MSDFSKDCTDCGACIDACPFLAQYGTPLKIVEEKPSAVFLCTSCRRCEDLCPLNLSPAAVFFAVKEKLVCENHLSAPVIKAVSGARTFARAGHGFPFSLYEVAETVFWPGCGLAANRPGLIPKVKRILSRHLRQKVGLVLDCCYDPVFGLGDTQTALVALREIHERLHDSGVKQVITGCLNCHKLLSEHLPDIEVIFILEVLSAEIFPKQSIDRIYLHHPCPASRWEKIPAAARIAANHIWPSAAFNAGVEKFEPLCCGLGAGLNSVAPELADRFLDEIVRKAKDKTVVTYCTGCQNRFLQRGMKSVHLLEYLTKDAPSQTVPSPVKQWFNRLVLATSARLLKPKFVILLIIVLLIAAGVYLNQQGIFSADVLKNILERHPVAAPVIFLFIYAVAPALFLPSIPITLAAGFFWGPVWGVVFSITGATIGACLPFFLSRYLLQDFVKSKISAERWQWLQDKVDQHGWKAVAFTRLIPVFPFNMLNYLFGLTPVAFVQYLWSTFVFMLPACIAFVAFGSSLGELIMRGNIKGVIIGIIIAAVAFLIPVALRPFFRKIGDDKTSADGEISREKIITEKKDR